MVPFICNFRGENNKAPRFYLGALNPAERTGFEPANRFCRLHAFQACLFNHSVCKGTNKRANNQIYLSFFNREYFPLHFFAFPI